MSNLDSRTCVEWPNALQIRWARNHDSLAHGRSSIDEFTGAGFDSTSKAPCRIESTTLEMHLRLESNSEAPTTGGVRGLGRAGRDGKVRKTGP
jgi:hypothetical protein